MSAHGKITAYVSLVCQQIRWKKAHSRVAKELENHIIDQRDSFMAQGLDEITATDKALINTGDAAAIGAQLDRTHRPKPQWTMLTTTAVLLLIGFLVRIFVYNNGARVGSISIQMIFAAIGIIGMFIGYFADFSRIGKYPRSIYFSILAFSIAVLCVSPVVNGRSYYAQYTVLLFPLAFALVVFAARNKGYIGIILCALAFVLPGVIALIIPSISGFLHFAASGIVLLSLAIWKENFGVKRSCGFLIMLAPIAVLAAAFVFNMNGYRWTRLATAFNPSLDPNGAGYWGLLTRELLSGAKLLGQGKIPEEYTAALTTWRYPIFYTDSLLTAIISLYGWLAFAIIISAILFFIIKGFTLCFKQKSILGFFVSLSIMMTFVSQTISYISYNLGFTFVSPISLPLISYGNTTTVINLVLIGFMLSVFRTGDIVKDAIKPIALIKNKLFTWDNGILTVYFKTRQR